jgi:DNA-binding NarL/FixJ family response regulator
MRILLASGNPSVAERWQTLLPPRHSADQVSTAERLQRLAAAGDFDLILLHRLLVDLQVFVDLRRTAPAARFFLLSDQPDEEEGLAFLKQGIVGYGNTYISRERLEAALQAIEADGVWLGQQVIRQLIIESYSRATRTDAANNGGRLDLLTRMERKVAELVARGQTNLEIAAGLDITERTVKAHLTAIYDKVGVGNRLSLALLVNQGSSR